MNPDVLFFSRFRTVGRIRPDFANQRTPDAKTPDGSRDKMSLETGFARETIRTERGVGRQA